MSGYIILHMALFLPGESRCPLCGQVLYLEDLRVATTHFLLRGQPLHEYSDAVMHRACFLRWEHRAAFIEAYNAHSPAMGDRMRADGTKYFPLPVRAVDGLLLIFVGPFFWMYFVVEEWWNRRRS